MRWLRLLSILLLVPLAACALNARPATSLDRPGGPYLLDSGDTLRIAVYGEADLSRSYVIDDTGAVAVPLAGPVGVRGLTTQLAAARIAAALAGGYIREPSVTVEVEQYRPFYIQGAVANGGQYPYVYGMTVRAAVSTAGGFSDTADRTRAVIHRRQGRQVVEALVDLDFPIYPSDAITVPERWF
ncbi:polysaccharide biosynthesis/export family protein [Devosia sp.]|uniref:polysaccharide biosynthesis/export family protein n=1 Tax=Devosia sp. TaxID=1871048 RepID=UPI002F03D878